MDEKKLKPKKHKVKKIKDEWIQAKVIGCRSFKVYNDELKQSVIYDVDGGSIIEINPNIIVDDLVAVRRGSIRGYGEKKYLKGRLR